MTIEQAQKAVQTAEADLQETRDRLADLKTEREDLGKTLAGLRQERLDALAAGESAKDLRGEKRRLTAAVEDLDEEIDALEGIADGRKGKLEAERRNLAAAERDELEARAAEVISKLKGEVEAVRETVGTLDALKGEHRRLNDVVRMGGGKNSYLPRFPHPRYWQDFRDALDRLEL